MKISRTDTNPLNSVITIKIERNDFEEKVSKILNDYRKKANIPGFRKGHVPIGMIKKQYETAVTAEEVNKLLQENLEKYLNDEKININTFWISNISRDQHSVCSKCCDCKCSSNFWNYRSIKNK